MDQVLERLLEDPALQSSATARLIVVFLTQAPEGERIEAIARRTGSRYRWVEATATKLTRDGILRRVGRATYAINPDCGVR